MSIKSKVQLPRCACARTREYCVTKGCKKDIFEWRYATEGRDQDHLRRIIDTARRNVPISRWVRPERAIAEAWTMNMQRRSGATQIIKFGDFAIDTPGVP